MHIIDYIKPELFIVSFALYTIGTIMKKTKQFLNQYIPMSLVICGIILCTLYIFATSELRCIKDIMLITYSGITQGISTAGVSVLIDQMIKQNISL